MGLFKKVALGAGLALAVVLGINHKKKKDEIKKIEKEQLDAEQKRKNTPCYFNGEITYGDFEMIVQRVVKRIKRLTVSIDGPRIYGTVRSQSGISTWGFTLDFNDWGNITGEYWKWQENYDSNIPKNVGDLIANEIKSLL